MQLGTIRVAGREVRANELNMLPFDGEDARSLFEKLCRKVEGEMR